MAHMEVPFSLKETWKQRVVCGVRLLRSEDADRIAELCAEREWSGYRYTNVWHEAAAFYGTKCQCGQCESGEV
jgi:hypothetical protein